MVTVEFEAEDEELEMVPGADEEDEDVVIAAGEDEDVVIAAGEEGGGGTGIVTPTEAHKDTAALRAALDRLDITLL